MKAGAWALAISQVTLLAVKVFKSGKTCPGCPEVGSEFSGTAALQTALEDIERRLGDWDICSAKAAPVEEKEGKVLDQTQPEPVQAEELKWALPALAGSGLLNLLLAIGNYACNAARAPRPAQRPRAVPLERERRYGGGVLR